LREVSPGIATNEQFIKSCKKLKELVDKRKEKGISGKGLITIDLENKITEFVKKRLILLSTTEGKNFNYDEKQRLKAKLFEVLMVID
jgi:hypothetical protein